MSEEGGASFRWRQAFAELGERAAPGPSCPEPDRLWAAATAESPAAERQEIIAHTATCAACAGAFRLALGLAREEAGRAAAGVTVEPHPFPARPLASSRTGLRRLAPFFGALAAALLLAILVPRWWPHPPVQYREGGEGGDRVHPLEVRPLVAEGAFLDRGQAVLRWSPGPPGSRYEVRVLTREAEEIAVEAGLSAPEYRVPPSALAGKAAGSLLYWQVKTLGAEGKSGMSKTFSFHLR